MFDFTFSKKNEGVPYLYRLDLEIAGRTLSLGLSYKTVTEIWDTGRQIVSSPREGGRYLKALSRKLRTTAAAIPSKKNNKHSHKDRSEATAS